jgi:hypothetical protein
MNSREYSRYLFHYGNLPTQYQAAPPPPTVTSFQHMPPVVIKDNYILQALAFHLSILSAEKTNTSYVVDCLLELVNLEDDLILLVLEISSIDVMFHQLTFQLATVAPAQNNCLRLGSFSPSTRVATLSVNELLFSTMIHEIAHACGYFTFKRDDTEPFATRPYPTTHANDFNPAKLKFLRCTREDKWRLQNNRVDDYLFSHDIDRLFANTLAGVQVYFFKFALKNFFSHIEEMYKGNLHDEKVLNEIFPFYIDMRAKLFKFSKESNLNRQTALLPLERYLPYLHQYFETDLKRTLQHRLYNSTVFYHLEDYKSLVMPFFFSRINPRGHVYRNDVVKVLRNHMLEHLLKSATPAITLSPSYSP